MSTAERAELVDHLRVVSTTWLPPVITPSTSLSDALSAAEAIWPDEWDGTGREPGPLLFPVTYAGQPALTSATFHHLVDAACEARRAGSEVVIVAVPVGRSGARYEAADRVSAIAAAYQDAGFGVTSAGDLADLAGIAPHLVAKVCASPFTRRHVDLPDVLVAAAAEALGTSWVYQPDSLGVGKHLGRVRVDPPLCRLFDSADPFAAPPDGTKRPPAGSDAVWASALTLAATGLATVPDDRSTIEQPVGKRLGPLWRRLRSQHLFSQRGVSAGDSSVRLRVESHHSGQPITVPLFGAPLIAQVTRTFVTAAALAGPVTLVVDDLTPRFCYRPYPLDTPRNAYTQLAAEQQGQAIFLTDVPAFGELLRQALNRLSVGQLIAACGHRHQRRRGGLTGHDAIHLAVMAVCCAHLPGTIAVRSVNVTPVRSMAPVFEPKSLVVCTGSDPHPERWNVQLPARWLSEQGGPDES